MSARVTSTHSNHGVTVQFVVHEGSYSSFGGRIPDEYTIQIQDREGNWSRYGGRRNYMTNYDHAYQQFLKACEEHLAAPIRPAFEVITH